MPPEDDDLREIDDLEMPRDTELDSDVDSQSDSLKNGEDNDPRKAFLDKFTDDTPKGVETADAEEDAEVDEILDSDDNEDPDDNDSETEKVKESKKPDKVEDPDEDDDEDDEDLDVDFSDLDLDTDEEEGDDSFDARQDLPKKVWKSTPKEAQDLISAHRRNAKRLERQGKEDHDHASWSRSLFDDAKKADTTNDQLMGLIETGFRISAGAKAGKPDAEAAQVFGEIALANGFRFETEPTELNLEGLQGYLQDQINEMDLPIETARDIMKAVRQSASEQKESASKASQKPAPVQHSRNWQDPENGGQPLDQSEAVRNDAVQKIATMNNRMAKKFGSDWSKLSERINQDVVAQQTATPVSATHWPALWKKAAEKHAKQFLRRRKAQKGRNNLRGNSESLSRGESVSGVERGEALSSREEFLRKYTN